MSYQTPRTTDRVRHQRQKTQSAIFFPGPSLRQNVGLRTESDINNTLSNARTKDRVRGLSPSPSLRHNQTPPKIIWLTNFHDFNRSKSQNKSHVQTCMFSYSNNIFKTNDLQPTWEDASGFFLVEVSGLRLPKGFLHNILGSSRLHHFLYNLWV